MRQLLCGCSAGSSVRGLVLIRAGINRKLQRKPRDPKNQHVFAHGGFPAPLPRPTSVDTEHYAQISRPSLNPQAGGLDEPEPTRIIGMAEPTVSIDKPVGLGPSACGRCRSKVQ